MGGIGGMRQGQTECHSRRVATPVCNNHLYPSSLATAKHFNCLSHLFVHPQKCRKPLILDKEAGGDVLFVSVQRHFQSSVCSRPAFFAFLVTSHGSKQQKILKIKHL